MRVRYRHEAGCGDTSSLSAPRCLCSLNNAAVLVRDPSGFISLPHFNKLIINPIAASLLMAHFNSINLVLKTT